MKKFFVVSFMCISILTACGKKANSNTNSNNIDTNKVIAKIDSVAFEVDTFHVVEKQKKCVDDACTTCDLYYERIKKPLLPVHDSVNRYIDTFMLVALNDISGRRTMDLKAIANGFIEDSQNPDFGTGGWNWEHSTTITRPVTEIISVNSNWGGFAGGAHGNYMMETANFFTSNGKRVTMADLFNDIPALNKMAVKYFKKDNELDANVDLMDQGWDFSDADFKLNENFDITSTSITWQYNPYEIAPYVYGAPSVTIPIKDIEKLMKIKLTDIVIQ